MVNCQLLSGVFPVISTSIQWAKMVTLHGEGYTKRDNAANLCCFKTEVHNAIVKFNADGKFHDRERSGRPRMTRPREDRLVRQIAMRSPKRHWKKICAILRL